MSSKHYITLEPDLEEAVVSASTLSVLIISSVGLAQPRRLWTHLLLFTFELPIKQNPLGESLLLPPEEPLQLAGDVRKEREPQISCLPTQQLHLLTSEANPTGCRVTALTKLRGLCLTFTCTNLGELSPSMHWVIKLTAHNHVLLTPHISFLASMAQQLQANQRSFVFWFEI